jgi:hypothetical protein
LQLSKRENWEVRRICRPWAGLGRLEKSLYNEIVIKSTTIFVDNPPHADNIQLLLALTEKEGFHD